MNADDRSASSPAERGYVLASVLIVVGIIAGFVAAYGTHVVLAGRAGLASKPLAAARETCQSGLVLARQGLLSGSAAPTFEGATVDVDDLGDGRLLVEVSALDADGLGARRKAALGFAPSASSAPDSPQMLPTLDAATVSQLLSDPSLPKLHVTSSQYLHDVDLEGLVIVHEGAVLALSGVVLRGCVVSAGVLGSNGLDGFEEEAAPKLLVAGDVRIDAHPALDGLAILLPDGVVAAADENARVQIAGDVVAYQVSLPLSGAVDGRITGVELDLADPAQLDRLGDSRRPQDWAGCLELGGTQQPVSLAFVGDGVDLEGLSPIIDFWNGG